ncbi:TPA: Shedu immune nuclease family protein [Klebsiella aerogenes]
MARFLPGDFSPEKFDIEIQQVFPNYTEVFYLPNQEDLDLAGKKTETPTQNKTLIAGFNCQDGYISIYPIITLPTHPKFLGKRYPQIEEIIIHLDYDTAPYSKDEVIDCLQRLPTGFIKDMRYGLGLIKDYRFIISAIEEQTPYKKIVIGEEDIQGNDEDYYYLNLYDFEKMRRDCDRIADRARTTARIIKTTITYNYLANLLGNEKKPLPTGNDTISRMLRIKVSDTDKQAAMSLVSEDKSAVEQTDTVTLTKLKHDIELVSLERLIESYESLLSKRTKEETWQLLFNENPFILSLAFGYPAIKISDQASVGGKRLTGNGEKITDYLIKNGVTNNLAIIEIKKPSSVLLNKAAYRGAVFCASTELTGSVTQVLDQCYQLQQNIATIKNNNRIYDIESYAVHCILIIGMMPASEDEKKSFEIYRRNSKNVQIITFDELLLKLRQLHNFLADCDNKEMAS